MGLHNLVLAVVKKLRIIALYFSGAILLLHSVVPHQHHDEVDSAAHYLEHQQAEGILDLLGTAFHLNLGSDHLESFKKSDQSQLQKLVGDQYQGVSVIASVFDHLSVDNTRHSFVTVVWREVAAPRGPPATAAYC